MKSDHKRIKTKPYLCLFRRPDIQAIRAQLANAAATGAAPAPARPTTVGGPMARVGCDERELARQGSLVDGEGIKIVIHDVDCDMREYDLGTFLWKSSEGLS